jgi:hypothetical protein
MKPTQEQVIAWAREADVWVVGQEPYQKQLERMAALAYEAGRKDENEACAKVSENGCFLHDDSPEARFGKACAAAIRARREQ